MIHAAPRAAGAADRVPIHVVTLPTPDGIAVDGILDRSNADAVAAEIGSIVRRERRRPFVVDLTEMVFDDCAGVRTLREALRSLAAEGHRIVVRTSDPVARLSFDVARVA